MCRPSADGARRRQRHRAFRHHHHGEQVAARVLDGAFEGIRAADRVRVEFGLAFAVGSVAEDRDLLAARAVVDPLHVFRRRHLPQPSVLRQMRRPVLSITTHAPPRPNHRRGRAAPQRSRDTAEHWRGAAEDDGGGGAAVDSIPPPVLLVLVFVHYPSEQELAAAHPSVPPPASAGTTRASGTSARSSYTAACATANA